MKTDRLLLREEEHDAGGGIALVLTAASPETVPEAVSKAAEALLSVSQALLENRVPHLLCWPDAERTESRRVGSPRDHEEAKDRLLHAHRPAEKAGPELPAQKIIRFDPDDESTYTGMDELWIG